MATPTLLLPGRLTVAKVGDPIFKQFQQLLSAYSTASSKQTVVAIKTALFVGYVVVKSASFGLLTAKQQTDARDIVGTLEKMLARKTAAAAPVTVDKADAEKKAQILKFFKATTAIINKAKVDATYREAQIQKMVAVDNAFSRKLLQMLVKLRPPGYTTTTTTTPATTEALPPADALVESTEPDADGYDESGTGLGPDDILAVDTTQPSVLAPSNIDLLLNDTSAYSGGGYIPPVDTDDEIPAAPAKPTNGALLFGAALAIGMAFLGG